MLILYDLYSFTIDKIIKIILNHVVASIHDFDITFYIS